jgi:diguanylate cyclase (GGDEF)-like protein
MQVDVNRYARIRLLVLAAVAVIAASVWLAGSRQRSAADRALGEAQAADEMLVAMLDEEAGLLGHVNTGDPELLQRYQDARLRFEQALANAEEGAPSGESDERAAIASQRRLEGRWRDLGERLLPSDGQRPPEAVPAATQGRLDRLMGRFREVNADFKADLRAERDRNQSAATSLAVVLILVLSLLFGTLGYVLFERRARREERRRRLHSRFSEVLQLARSEEEAYGVVKDYLEQLVPDSDATVLNRNSSANRLEPRTPVNADSVLDFESADPQACLAIRGGRTYRRRAGAEDLMTCEVCGALSRDVTCVPSLVGGEVIGSVLIDHPGRLPEAEAAEVAASISEAAPVISNLRNLAIAQLRASTDALTGLPNHRSVRVNLKRLCAQAMRSGFPLAAIMFDLDRFKQINDTYGHAKGDQVLATVAQVTAGAIRASDFAGREGGEEFVVLLPGTDREQAVLVAENLRKAVALIQVPDVERPITASFGVAVLPDDTAEPEGLLRCADRALYVAKSRGRNRVELVENGRPATPANPRLAGTPE